MIEKVPPGSNYYIKSSQDLFKLLHRAKIDYFITYQSEAEKNKLPFMNFPVAINLGNPELKPFYSKARERLVDGSWMYGTSLSSPLVLVYSKESTGSTEINPQNWMEILLKNNVRYARVNPVKDDLGYQTLILWRLADNFYSMNPKTRQKFLDKSLAKKDGIAFRIYINDKIEKEFSREDLMEFISKNDFQYPLHPVKKGISLVQAFKELNLKLKDEDQILVEGQKEVRFTYSQAQREMIGMVPTMRGTSKLVAKMGPLSNNKRGIDSHVHTIKINQK
jgi:ABC-type molybdate transport system substrate-binding protein